jgi:hypothetical protein
MQLVLNNSVGISYQQVYESHQYRVTSYNDGLTSLIRRELGTLSLGSGVRSIKLRKLFELQKVVVSSLV